VLFVTGEFDSIAPTSQIKAIHQKWRGSELLRVRQGHFGYRMMRETLDRLKERGDLHAVNKSRPFPKMPSSVQGL
jgi:poly(3-hydroxyalkanoate) synthetase